MIYIDPENPNRNKYSLTFIEISQSKLISAIGKQPSTKMYRAVGESLARLSQTLFTVEHNNKFHDEMWVVTSNLISIKKILRGERLYYQIALNFLSSLVLSIEELVSNETIRPDDIDMRYIRTDLSERFSLTGSISRLLHYYLTSRVRRGERRFFNISSLLDIIYLPMSYYKSPQDKKLKRDRSAQIIKYCDDLNTLKNWYCQTKTDESGKITQIEVCHYKGKDNESKSELELFFEELDEMSLNGELDLWNEVL